MSTSQNPSRTVERIIGLWQRAGCYEPGTSISAEREVAYDDVIYDNNSRPLRRPPGVEPIFLEGPSYRGRPTRVFAWIGVPPRAGRRRVPGMVLVHGGGGTAFAYWVRQWVRRGYAAIAIDTNGNLPRGPAYRQWLRHDHGGPPGWGGFDQIDQPLTDQWPFHAVAAVIRAHSHLRSLPDVDPARIGMTGISWGGYLACLVAAADDRFRFINPIYGCGFFGERDRYGVASKPCDARWLRTWDASVYLPHARRPMLWLNGTNDHTFPLVLWQRSHELPSGQRTLCLKVRYSHSHAWGRRPQEIAAYADAFCNGAPQLIVPKLLKSPAGQLRVSWPDRARVVSARLCYATDDLLTVNTAWQTRRIAGVTGHGPLVVPLPPAARWAFINVIDARRLTTSTPLVRVEEMER